MKTAYNLLLIYVIITIFLMKREGDMYVAQAERLENQVVEVIMSEVTAYTSSVDETDDTPYLTASGDLVGPETVACPSRYSFGTKIQIEKRVFICKDRMNKRFRDKNYFDIWVESKEIAKEFGRKKNIEVLILK